MSHAEKHADNHSLLKQVIYVNWCGVLQKKIIIIDNVLSSWGPSGTVPALCGDP